MVSKDLVEKLINDCVLGGHSWGKLEGKLISDGMSQEDADYYCCVVEVQSRETCKGEAIEYALELYRRWLDSGKPDDCFTLDKLIDPYDKITNAF
ncbi:hypothetical protein ASV39_001575 [Vibrio parahaemolyticus]|nr:hypothetical protein [Vibrio parahaemolyticus]